MVLFIRRIYIHKAFVQELTQWKEKQAHLLVEFTDNTEDLQIFQDSPLQLTAPMVSNQKIKLKKKNACIIKNDS